MKWWVYDADGIRVMTVQWWQIKPLHLLRDLVCLWDNFNTKVERWVWKKKKKKCWCPVTQCYMLYNNLVWWVTLGGGSAGLDGRSNCVVQNK